MVSPGPTKFTDLQILKRVRTFLCSTPLALRIRMAIFRDRGPSAGILSNNDHITLSAPVHTRTTSPVLTKMLISSCVPHSHPLSGSSGSPSLGGNPSNSCSRQSEPPWFGPFFVWPAKLPAALHTHVHHSQCRSVRDSEAGGGTGQADGRKSAGGFQ
jgi:hypothetical protein